MTEIIEVGNIKTGSWSSPQYGRIYSTKGLSPSLTTMQGGGREPKIVSYESEEDDTIPSRVL